MRVVPTLRSLCRLFIRVIASLRQKPRLEVTYVYRHDLVHLPQVEVRWGGRVEVRPITLEEVPLLREVWPVDLRRMHKRLKRGDSCYCAFLDGRIASYLWFQTHGWHYIQPMGRWMRIRAGEVICYHERVAEWARGRRVSPLCYVYALRRYRQDGYRTAWVYTTATNFASQKSKEHAGWTFAGVYRSLVIGLFRIPLPGIRKEGYPRS